MSAGDLAELRKQCITSLYLCTDNVSKYLDQEKEKEFSKLKSYVKDYCIDEAYQDVAIQALEKAKRETDSTNVETLESRFSEHLTSMAGKRLNVDRHPYMIEWNSRVQKANHSARNAMDDSDLAITETQEQVIDPLTKRPIVDPVKNTVCGHVYEKDTIMSLLSKKANSKCPVVGCGNRQPIQKTDLISDEELRFRLTLTQHSTMIQERSIMDLDASM